MFLWWNICLFRTLHVMLCDYIKHINLIFLHELYTSQIQEWPSPLLSRPPGIWHFFIFWPNSPPWKPFLWQMPALKGFLRGQMSHTLKQQDQDQFPETWMYSIILQTLLFFIKIDDFLKYGKHNFCSVSKPENFQWSMARTLLQQGLATAKTSKKHFNYTENTLHVFVTIKLIY